MGNAFQSCCKKKGKKSSNPNQGDYIKANDSSIKDSETLRGDLPDTNPEQFQGQIVDIEAGHPELDEECLKIIKELNLGPQLDFVKERVGNFSKDDLKKITDDKDDFTMFFDVKTDENKEKYHVTVNHSKTPLSPIVFKLSNVLISEEDELRMTSGYERFYTLFRARIDGIFYVINYALYKQILLFSKKDMLFLKAFKRFDNGDVAEITMTINHPEFEVKPKIERMSIIENIVYYSKTDTGSDIIAINKIYPKVGAGFTILKPILSKTFRSYFKTLDEYLSTVKTDEDKLSKDFDRFKKINY